MGRTATIIAVSYAVVVVLSVVAVVAVAISTRSRKPEPDRHLMAEREKVWFVIVVVLLAALLFATIFFTPYGRSAGPDKQVVNIRAVQFAWLVPGTPIHAGRPVEFHLTSGDVNHGFAVYTAGGTFLFQVQVMPGHTQEYVWTFHRPGRYRILCLEYCGLDHDKMAADLTIVP